MPADYCSTCCCYHCVCKKTYYQQYTETVEQTLRDEIARLKDRVSQLEGVKAPPPYEVRLYVNDRWKSTYKASDRIKLVEHTYLGSDRTLYKRL